MNILVTGARAPVALDLARRCHRAGHRVIMLDSFRESPGLWSRCVAKSYVTPQPAFAFNEFAAALGKIVDDEQIDWIIPTCEEVFFIAACQDQLNCRVLTDRLDKLRQLHDKWTFSQHASNEFTRVPETVLIPPPAARVASSTPLPWEGDETSWVFKPTYSRFASRTLIGPSRDVLQRMLSNTTDSWVAQRRVRGCEYCSYSVAINGELVAHVAYESLYRAGLGAGIYFQPRELPPIAQFVRTLVRQHNYTGQIGCDFIRDDAGQFWVLEANPRATSGLHLFDNGPELIHVMLQTGDSTAANSSPLPRIDLRPSMVEFAMPLWGLRDALRHGKLLRFLPDCLTARWAMTSVTDPVPTLILPVTLAYLIRTSLREGISQQAASTRDLEWNGEELGLSGADS
ncbi:MAG: hypothetical protein KDA58_01860 [Planctomycetaceae bacterium]|nr:hypothetical protein [Planctomycetaceae bacterium]